MDKIEELLKNPQTDLQKQALTDKSYKKTPNNQDCKINFELATYGDAILKCALCKIYFERENKDNFGFKGKLTEWKKQYESDEVLIKLIARHHFTRLMEVFMEKKETTPRRAARRSYEERNKDKRKQASGNFGTMIPRDLFDEINAFLKERNMTKVDFIRMAYEIMKSENNGTHN